MCCHTEIEVADQTIYLTQSQYADTGPTSPSADPMTPGAWQGSHWSANFEVTGMTRPRKTSRRKRDSNPGCSALEADALPLGQRGGFLHRMKSWMLLLALVGVAYAVQQPSFPDFGLLTDDEIVFINKVQSSWKVSGGDDDDDVDNDGDDVDDVDDNDDDDNDDKEKEVDKELEQQQQQQVNDG